jgi:insulysin
MNNIQYFDIEVTTNEKRNIKGLELENKIKIVFVSDPDINISSCSIGIGAGYLQDEFPGTAHFLEHLLFMGSEKYPEQNDYHSYIQINGGYDNAFTGDNITCYYLCLETTFLKKGIEMLSWFFRAPLLDEKHIESEMEIIDSEHQKNILMDAWIMDDIFKNFISDNNKYKKFGTGNLESLKNITKNDILGFYNKYYTTDNIFVCVVDSKPINVMINEYIEYFRQIPLKIYSDDTVRFEKNKLRLIDDELIIFSSSSEYNFVNIYLVLDANEKNIIEYQIINFISYMIGCEYEYSLGYYLKENNLVKSINSNIEYFYDYSTNINIQLIMYGDEKKNFYKSIYLVERYILSLKNINDEEFEKIYNNFRKIKMLNLLYGSNSDPVEVSNMIVDNMIKGNMVDSVIRQDNVPEYKKFIYSKYIEIIDSIQVKITTNINVNSVTESDFVESKWYKSKFSIQRLDFNHKQDKDDKFELKTIVCDYKISHVIGIKDFIIKMNINKNVDKLKLPELIDSNNILKRKVYLLEDNKYDKPIGNISILRKNILLLEKHNKIVIGIYLSLCEKILNYFLDVMSNYKLNFSISLSREYLIYNFNGINYELSRFMSIIIRHIYPETIFHNNKCQKYFNDIINDIKENIKNFKYNSPYIICSKYLYWLLDNSMLPNEKLDFINNLTFDEFIRKVSECLKYSNEYYILTGIKKYGFDLNINVGENYSLRDDKFILDIIDMLSLDSKKYLIHDNDKFVEEKINFTNWIISKNEMNLNEVNNCVIRYWEIKKVNTGITNTTDSILSIDIAKKIIKTKLISSFVSDIFNEPLFDKIRTIDKLGYIVKADNKIVINSEYIHYIILFLIQSTYSIKRIYSSLENFNEFISLDLKNNYESYTEKFRLIKESKMLEFAKPFSDLLDEINSYIESIISNIFVFDLNSLYLEVCEDIEFSRDIEPIILKIIKNDSDHKDIILDKNKKN